MTHVMVTLFPCYPQTMQSLLSIEGGAEILHRTPVTPQFHGTRETQRPSCSIHAGVLHGMLQIMAFGTSAKRVQENGSRGAMRRRCFLQLQTPTTITSHAVDCGQETDPHTRGRIRGVWVRSSLSLFMATTWGSHMCICSNPPSPVPVYIVISQGLTSNTALGWWYRPLWRGRVVTGTRAKRKGYILRTR